MYRLHPRRVAVAMLLVLAFSTPAIADCPVGKRIFPGTLTLDDPCIDDELTLPIITSFQNGDIPSAEELDLSGEYSKDDYREFWRDFRRGLDTSRRSRRWHPRGLRQSRYELQVSVRQRCGR